MTVTEFASLKVGQIVYYVSNTGMAGIFRYQYIGIVKNSFNGIDTHVLLSEHMVSTRAIEVGKEKTSRSLPDLFSDEKEAKSRQLYLKQINTRHF